MNSIRNILKRGFPLLITFLFISSPVKPETINTTHISIAQGLSDSRVTSIMQDSYGFLWIGTMNGLDRYDGYNFTIYKHESGNDKTIGDSRIINITEDKDHNLWVAQWNGISRFNRYSGTFKNYPLNKYSIDFTSSRPKIMSIYCDSHNNMWAGELSNQMTGGLLKYNRKTDTFNMIKYDSSTMFNNNASGNYITSICEYKGKLWVLSNVHGLCYYDARKDLLESQNIFPADQVKKTKIFDYLGTGMYPDMKGNLWITTLSGIYKFDTDNKNLFEINKLTGSINNGPPSSGITEDNEGNVWIGYALTGLLKFKGTSVNFSRMNYNGPSSSINCLYRDKSGIIWIGTFTNGVFKYDPTGNPFTNFTIDFKNKNGLMGNRITALCRSSVYKGLIYVGTQNSDFYKFYPDRNKFDKINIQSENNISPGPINSIIETNDGSVYLGTSRVGLLEYMPDGRIKQAVKFASVSKQGLWSNHINVLAQDARGRIWIGTGFGLNIYNPDTKKISRISSHITREYPPELLKIIRSEENSPDVIQSILKVGNNENLTKKFRIKTPGKYLCVSAGEGGLLFYNNYNSDYGWIENQDKDTIWSARSPNKTFYLGGTIKNVIAANLVELKPGNYELRYQSDDSHSYGHWNAAPPPDSQLWGVQVIKLDNIKRQDVEQILNTTKDQLLTGGYNIVSIYIDFNGIAWLGTFNNGLTEYNPGTGKIKYFKSEPGNAASLSSNNISYIIQDKNGIFWLATQKGLDSYNAVSGKFNAYTEENGLPTNNLTTVLQDNRDNFWISSPNGITKMTIEPKTGKASFVNFDTRDGIAGNNFLSPEAASKGANGRLYFGCDQGITSFSPESFNTAPPIVRITDIKLSNKSVTAMGREDPLKVPVMSAKKMTLSSSQNNISFEFAALQFSQPEKNGYSHILEGYDKNWNHDNRRFASYTNLDPGKYIFKVRASNNDGIWNNKGTSLTVIILPPWWKTGWAYAGYVLLLAGLVFSADRFQRKRLLSKERERQKIREMELRAKAAEAESKALEIENKRKTKELDEARQLQLSMLPKQIPSLPHLDIAVYMKTATEVGGDYYDFHLHPDGTLTVILGDATGHGMQSGMMVSIMKSLFMSDRNNKELRTFFENAGAAIKDMHLGRLMMGLNCIQLHQDSIVTANAGMPPLFIYRNSMQAVEEIQMSNMPLGAMKGLSYNTLELKIDRGDTILMMSDGFAELKNGSAEQYGYRRARNCFEDVGRSEPEEIVNRLKEEGIQWTNNREPEDDVTFVVIKVK